MLSKNLTIINRLGLHARAAAKLVSTASGYGAQVTLIKENQEVNGKSIMGVMMLAASQGTELEVRTEGEDAEDAMNAIEALINDYFGEGE